MNKPVHTQDDMGDAEYYTAKELLQMHTRAIDGLQSMKVIRTRNNPCGDYAEYLAASVLNLTLESNSKNGYDATDSDNRRIQIKSRQLIGDRIDRDSIRLSAVRGLLDHKFDDLICVVFTHEWDVYLAVKLPHEALKKYAYTQTYTNSSILYLRKMLDDPALVNLTRLFNSRQTKP